MSTAFWRKKYSEHGCDDSTNPTIDAILSPHYECDGADCFGHLVLETYANCDSFVSGQVNSCSCGSSTVEILNTNICILYASGSGSFIVFCDSDKVTYQYFSDMRCQNETGGLQYKYEGCIEADRARYSINMCSRATRHMPFVLASIYIALVLLFVL